MFCGQKSDQRRTVLLATTNNMASASENEKCPLESTRCVVVFNSDLSTHHKLHGITFCLAPQTACGSIRIVNMVDSKTTATNLQASGRDELNLIDFPISVLQSKQPVNADGTTPDELVCTIESYDRHLDRVVPRKLTRRTASKHGFPTPVEEEVLIGLLTLTRIKNNFTSARVRFCNSELYRLLGWPSNGNRNERLRVTLDRLKGLTLKYENAWTRGGDKFEKELTTNLLDAYQFVRQTDGDPADGKETSWIQWASEVFADMQRGNVKELNTDRYFSFSRPISRRLYRILDKQLSESASVSIDLHTLAIQLGITGTTHVGKIKERIAPGLKEVEQKGELIAPPFIRQALHQTWAREMGRTLLFNQIKPNKQVVASSSFRFKASPSTEHAACVRTCESVLQVVVR